MARSTYKKRSSKSMKRHKSSKKSTRKTHGKSKKSTRKTHGKSKKLIKKSSKQRGAGCGCGAAKLTKGNGSVYGAGVYWPAGLARPF